MKRNTGQARDLLMQQIVRSVIIMAKNSKEHSVFKC